MSEGTLPSPPVLLEDLRFGYGASQPVLDIAELRVAAGERVMVEGPSGSGKSTLLGLLAGIVTPSGGRVEMLGRDVGGLSARERDRFRGAHVGYIFQMFNLIPYLGVAENIALPCRLSPRRRERLAAPSVDQAVETLAGRLGIEDLLDRPVTQLSVGQQQRVAAARALIGAPEVILADEPTSALDADRRDRFLELLFEHCREAGSTLIFVSHDPGLARHFDRRVSLQEINRAGAAA